MTDHTPVPWTCGEARFGMYAVESNGDTIAESYSYDSKGRAINAAANAAFIVKAVNNHADLLKALELAEDVLSRAPFSTGVWPNGTHPQTGIEQIRDAIKAAS